MITLIRWIFQGMILGLIKKVLGAFFPILLRLPRLIGF
jgi:hypothetical protein